MMLCKALFLNIGLHLPRGMKDKKIIKIYKKKYIYKYIFNPLHYSIVVIKYQSN